MNVEITEPINEVNLVKARGYFQANLLCSSVLYCCFAESCSDYDQGIYIRLRTTRKLFRRSRLNADSLSMHQLIRDLLSVGDCDLVVHTDFQYFMDFLSVKRLGLTISIAKTEVMYQIVLDKSYIETSFFNSSFRA